MFDAAGSTFPGAYGETVRVGKDARNNQEELVMGDTTLGPGAAGVFPRSTVWSLLRVSRRKLVGLQHPLVALHSQYRLWKAQGDPFLTSRMRTILLPPVLVGFHVVGLPSRSRTLWRLFHGFLDAAVRLFSRRVRSSSGAPAGRRSVHSVGAGRRALRAARRAQVSAPLGSVASVKGPDIFDQSF